MENENGTSNVTLTFESFMISTSSHALHHIDIHTGARALERNKFRSRSLTNMQHSISVLILFELRDLKAR